jgi:hypothetical protein
MPFRLTRRGVVVAAVLAFQMLSVKWLSAADTPDLYDTLNTAIQDNRLFKTKAAGNGGKTAFLDVFQKSGVLIGFDLGLGKFGKAEMIYAFRPLYLTAEGVRTGTEHGLFTPGTKNGKPIRSSVQRTVTIRAKQGYAVGGLTIRAGTAINGLEVRFVRLDGARLNPRDDYVSDWVGDRNGGSEIILDSKGMPVVGIHGKENEKDCMSLGLVYIDPALVPAPKPEPMPSEEVKPSKPEPEAKPAPRVEVAEEKPEARVADRPAAKPAEARRQQAAGKTEPESDWSMFLLVGGVIVVLVGGGALFFVMSSKKESTPGVESPTSDATPVPLAEIDRSTSSVNLPPELEAKARRELSADEQILWAGQVSPRVASWRAYAAASGCVFMGLIAGLMLVSFLLLTKGPMPRGAFIFPGVTGLFLVISVAGIFLAPAMQRKVDAGTYYIVTNRRAIVHKPGWFGEGSVDSYTPAQLQNMVRRDSWFIRGAGDLVFHSERQLVVTSRSGRYGGTSVRERIIRYGFLGIDNPGEVEKIVRQVLVDPLVDKYLR